MAGLRMSVLMAKAMGAVLGLILGIALLWVLPAPQPSGLTEKVPPSVVIRSISAALTLASDRKAVHVVMPPPPSPPLVQSQPPKPPAQRRRGTLSLNVSPGNARVYIDGHLVSAQIEIQLDAGPHTLIIEVPGTPVSSRTSHIKRNIVITANQTTRIVERM